MSTTTNNLKQRFIRLLRKFKVPETEAFESEEQYKGYMEQVMAQEEADLDDFIDDDDIGDFSDSGQEFDDISISSTPKPSLKPYFSTWTLEGPRDSTSINNTFIGGAEAAPTTSNSHDNTLTSPLSTTSSSTTTTNTTTVNTTNTTAASNTSVTNNNTTVNPEDKKSSKLRRILRKKDSNSKSKK